MNSIPDISFKNSDNKTYFELLNLSRLFPRLDTIEDHNPKLPHRISFFALLVVTKGTGKHYIDLKEYNLEKGSVLKIAKGQVHAFQKNANYEGYLMVFTEDFVLNYFSKSSIKLISHLYNYHLISPITNNLIGNESFINQLKTEIETQHTFAQNNIIAALLDLYLLKLERFTNKNQIEKSISANHDTFINFKNLVEQDFKTTRNVKDYANKMYISTKTLNSVVKEFTLNTAKIFIDNFVILEVKRDIISTNKSIKEIAFDKGFDEVTNFTKFFKKNTNTTPKEFRISQNL